ncbi:MAG: hypothetical protein R2699_08045 [Acidimicrobiales bacterium]
MDGAARGDARRGDDAVEAAARGDDAVDPGADRRRVGDVELGVAVALVLGERWGRRGDVGTVHHSAFGEETLAGGQTDARAGPGDGDDGARSDRHDAVPAWCGRPVPVWR